MSAFDSILNVEEWLSDHYLTNDDSKGASFSKRVRERIKEWKTTEDATQQSGPLTRFSSNRLQLQHALSELDDATTAASLVASALGYGVPSVRHAQRGADTMSYSSWVGNAGSVEFLVATPAESFEEIFRSIPLEPVTINDKPQDITAAKLVGQIFLSDTPPAFVVITAGKWVVLAERETWPLGRYLAIDISLVVERNDTKAQGEMQQAVVALARENTERAADGTTWWEETIEQSREHAVKVSGELRSAVRESIEILGNDVLTRYEAKELSTAEIDGGELAKQSLRYLYRILFLLFAEASPELEILPTGTPEYDEGYGLARLRELILNPPVTQHARTGTHLYDSLQLLFTLVDKGHNPTDATAVAFDAEAGEEGLHFRNLSADLFLPAATELIDRVGLSNEALNKVLENLLLSRVQSGKDRGFISYATLGVTELGQVYEGLMSYTGFIAQEDLFEVAPHGKADKGSWMLPVSKADEVPADSFIEVDQEAPGGGVIKVRKRHPRGSFVFRQSSRDRERSASFYTPQVLTSFTVTQAIEELQASKRITTANDVLSLTICEPAMGSGAFAVEAVRQLAELYLELRQEELEQQIPAEDRAKELQKVKAHIALHQVYGVDLNSTAVELAEISLWLDTMNAEMDAPWYGLHLRNGNSLVGATRSLYAPSLLNKKAWLTATPTRYRLDDIAQAIDENKAEPLFNHGIHHFLLPSTGWGATAEAKDLKDLMAAEIKELKSWRASIRASLSKTQIKQLNNLALRVETLWRFVLMRIRIAESQISRSTTLWGQEPAEISEVVTREQIEQDLFGNIDGAYNRLRLVMDAWCALWFWPLDAVATAEHPERPALPDLDEWFATLTEILGIDLPLKSKNQNQIVLGPDTNWLAINDAEATDLGFSGALSFERVSVNHPWINVARQVAKQQSFFHWDLDFAHVFAKGGFDLQVGNPPWVRPDVNFEDLLAEHDPWWAVMSKPTQASKKERQKNFHNNPKSLEHVVSGVGETVATSAILGSVTLYPHLKDQRPDLYRGFMEKTWSNASPTGAISLIHPESHFTEKKAAPLRRGAYERLHRHWQFLNEFVLFDIDHHVSYGVHVYGAPQESINFLSAAALYHPQTVLDSFDHDGSGNLPGLKDDNGNWDRRPHKDRIQLVNAETLKVWKSILEDEETPYLDTRMVYTVNTEAAAVLEKLASAPRIKELGLQFSSGWNETTDKKKGYFDVGWTHPTSWADAILQGPHLGVATPMIKQPNPTMKHNQDWSEIDFEAMPADFIPATAYQPNRQAKPTYDADYGTWTFGDKQVQVADTFRIAWRRMAATTGYRTMYPSVIPVGTRHVHTVVSAGHLENNAKTILTGASLSSLLIDFRIRSGGTSEIQASQAELLPIASESPFSEELQKTYLRLNCLTSAYAPLWEEITGEPWEIQVPLRNAEQRRAAQNDIDAMVALSLGISADELCMIYRTQFPVMRKYDQEDHFDANGRKVPKEIIKLQQKLKDGQELSVEKRTWVHPQSEVSYTFEYPFRVLDREADLRAAYAKFENQLKEP